MMLEVLSELKKYYSAEKMIIAKKSKDTNPTLLENMSKVWSDSMEVQLVDHAELHVAHREALVIVYLGFTEFTWMSDVPQFSRLARLLNPELNAVSDFEATPLSSTEIIKFLIIIQLHKSLSDVKIPETEIMKLACQCMVLPNYKGNPRVASRDEMVGRVKSGF